MDPGLRCAITSYVTILRNFPLHTSASSSVKRMEKVGVDTL